VFVVQSYCFFFNKRYFCFHYFIISPFSLFNFSPFYLFTFLIFPFPFSFYTILRIFAEKII